MTRMAENLWTSFPLTRLQSKFCMSFVSTYTCCFILLTWMGSLLYSTSDEITHILHISKELPPFQGSEGQEQSMADEVS